MNLDRAYHADVVAHEAVVGVHHEDEDRDGEADSRLVEAQPHRGLATPHGCSRPAGLRREGGGLTAAAHGDGNFASSEEMWKLWHVGGHCEYCDGS